MKELIEITFWIAILGTLYSYFIYPIILLILPKCRRQRIKSESAPASISLIITARNEEHQIEEKINNSLEIKYPDGFLEIIVASDASTDATDQIVSRYADKGVKLVRVEDGKGKENAQLHAIQVALGDILVFSDVATIIPAEALLSLTNYFNDGSIGAVSSEDRLIGKDDVIEGEGAYVRYEMWVRKLESEVYSLVGLSGSFFACRKKVAENWDISIPSDFNTALNTVREGLVAVTAPDVLGYYKSISDSSKEYNRKYRTALRGMSALKTRPDVLNPLNDGKFAFEVISHKLMRWLVPWFIVVAIITNINLVNESWVYMITMQMFVIFFGLSLVGFCSKALRSKTIFGIPFFFSQVNIALMQASIDMLRGKHITVWKPSRR
jgi:cellulose synthase/poly-beta-1,6-N-acetylglucosamine synthase-like glycosyltransferase